MATGNNVKKGSDKKSHCRILVWEWGQRCQQPLGKDFSHYFRLSEAVVVLPAALCQREVGQCWSRSPEAMLPG